MSKLLNRSLKKFMIYAGLVLVCSIPVYYAAINMLWQYELDEHNIMLTPEAGREDRFLIIGAVTLLTVLFFALLLGGLVLLNRRISRRLWQPFYQSLARIKNFDLNRQTAVAFEKTDIAEFEELNQSLHKLISGNVMAYTQQKEFADNASHELQTPLAIVQSKLELLLQSRSLTDEQYHITEDALLALARVSRINKNLLLLAKMENSQFMEKEMIDLSALLENTISLFINFSEGKQVEWETNLLPGVVIEGNKILVEILLNNLIKNAVRYSVPHSVIAIGLSFDKLSISNAGTQSLQPEQLFKRFASVSSKSSGTGLGLALVKQISDRYGWRVHYDFNNGLHTFSLHF